MKNSIKRIFTFLLTLTIAFSVFATPVYAATVSLDKNVTYNIVFRNGQNTYGNVDLPHIFSAPSASADGMMSSFIYSNTNICKIDKNESVTVSLIMNNGEATRYEKFNTLSVNVHCYDDKEHTAKLYDKSFYEYDGGVVYSDRAVITCSFDAEQSGYYAFTFNLGYPVVSNANTDTFVMSVTDIKVETVSESQSLGNKISSLFNSLFEWLRNIKDNLSELGSSISNGFSNLGNRISGFFNSLGDRISGFFTNLGNEIKDRFSDLKNNLSTFFSNVGNWFKSLGDNISGFFEKLWNRIWWGNENGESEYVKPVISNKLNDILDILSEYQIQLKETIDTINNAADEVSNYIQTGTSLVNGIINVAGVGFSALIIFGIVFVLARKVVGR
ncbi:MAG: hypothetical protein K2H01_05745 [Ruminococcus sp.]|nr:hypothetical protein [Ruminococcus sp.]